jgi:hypothetical protein
MNTTKLLTALVNATTMHPHTHADEHAGHSHEHHDHVIHSHEEHEHNIPNENENSYDIIVAKGTAMLVLFSASMMFGLIPFKLAKIFKWTDPHKDARTNFVVSTLLSFGGGVLVSTFI